MSPESVLITPKPAAPVSQEWTVRVLDCLDDAQLTPVMAFLREHYMPKDVDPFWSEASFKWKLGASNPAGRGFLTAAVCGNAVVGTTSVTRKRLWMRGRQVMGAEIGDTFTHPDFLKSRTATAAQAATVNGRSGKEKEASHEAYLSRSIFGRLVTETKARALDAGIAIIYGTPNKNSRAGYEKRLNFRAHPTHRNFTFIRPTVLGVARKRPALAKLSWLLQAGEFAFNGAASAVSRVKTGGRYAYGELSEATEALDHFWQRVRDQRAFSLVRDRAYFQHRFFEHPLARYRVHTATERGELCGVLVSREWTTSWGKRYCSFADWLTDERHPQALPALLMHVLRRQDRSAIEGFHLWCEERAARRYGLAGLGFLRLEQESPVIFFQNAPGNEILNTIQELDFTIASSDNI